ncbi:carbohydrate porin [Imbroritus primus]|uniref:carbohydrate porin n=1 Tax=Imbroritus primus TaxID=3058603 RepID=UPI003D161AD0
MSVVVKGGFRQRVAFPWIVSFCLGAISVTGGCALSGIEVPEAEADWHVPEPDSAIAQAIARSARTQRIHSVYGLCARPGGCANAPASGSARMERRLVELDDGVTVRVVVEGHAPAAAHDGAAVPVDPAVALPQLYGEVSGLDLFNGGTLWAGRRPAVAHMPSTGEQPGGIPAMSAGLERMHLFGPLRFNYTYAEAANTTLGIVPAYHHFRIVDIPANTGGTLQLGMTRIGGVLEDGLAEPTPRGWWLSAMHRQEDVLAATNRLAIQRGGGGLPGPLQDWQDATSLERWRVADTLDWKFPAGLSGTLGAAMQVDRSNDGEARWVSLSARPVFALDRVFQVALQVAHDRLAAEAASANRTTFTVAPSWTFGKTQGDGSIHAYYSYSRLSDPLNPINFSALSGDAMVMGPGTSFGVRLQRQW